MRNLLSTTLCGAGQAHARVLSSRIHTQFINTVTVGTDRNSSADFLSHHHCPLFLHSHNTFTIMSVGVSGSSSLDPTSLSAVTRLAPQQASARAILPSELNRILTQLSDLQTQAHPGDKPQKMGAIAPAVWTGLGLCSNSLSLDHNLAFPSRGVVSGPGPPTRLVTALGSGKAIALGSRLHATVSMAAEATQWQYNAQAQQLWADYLQR